MAQLFTEKFAGHTIATSEGNVAFTKEGKAEVTEEQASIFESNIHVVRVKEKPKPAPKKKTTKKDDKVDE